MRQMSGLALVFLSIVFVTTGCARLNLFKRGDGPVPPTQGPRVGSPAPDLEGVDFEGQRFKLSDYRGKVVVVSFWASWCKPCCDLIPHERALVNRFAGRNFVLLGANVDDNRDAALKNYDQALSEYRLAGAHEEAGHLLERLGLLMKGNEGKLDPALYSDSSALIGILMFPLKDAAIYCGFLPEKIEVWRRYQRLLHKKHRRE